MATNSSILDWEIPWEEEPGELQSMGSQKSDTAKQLKQQLPKHDASRAKAEAQ